MKITKSKYNWLVAQYNYRKNKEQLIEISDEEYQRLTGETVPQGPIGNTEPQGPTGNTEPQGPIGNTEPMNPNENDKLNANDIYEIYEDENNELILNIKNNNIANIKLGTNYNLNYGKNIITPLIKNVEVYQYSYEQQYILYLSLTYNNKSYTYDILFTLNNNKEYYNYSVIQKPKFNLIHKDYNTFEIKLINNLIYSHNNKEYIINDISKFNIKFTDFYNSIATNSPKINIISNTQNTIEFNFDIDEFVRLNYTGAGSGYSLEICCYLKNIIDLYNGNNELIRLSKILYRYPSDDYYCIFRNTFNSFFNGNNEQFVNNIITNNINKIYTLNYTININHNNSYTPNIKGLINNDLDLYCRILNCQKNTLRIYNRWEFGINRNFNEFNDFDELLNNINNIYDINIIKNNNLIFRCLTYDWIQNWQIREEYINNLSNFKLFITANYIDYILVNCGYDVTTPTEHFIINSENGIKTIL